MTQGYTWIQEIGFNVLKCTNHRRVRAFVTLQPCAFHHITPILGDIQYNGITLSCLSTTLFWPMYGEVKQVK